VYTYFDGLSPPDTNIPTSIFVLPILLMLVLLLKHGSAMASDVISAHSAKAGDPETPVAASTNLLTSASDYAFKASAMISLGICSLSICFFFLAVGEIPRSVFAGI